MDLSTLSNLSDYRVIAENTVQAVTDEKGYSYVWAVVFTGLAVVFLALVILILFVWLMGKVFSAIEKSKERKAERTREHKVIQGPPGASANSSVNSAKKSSPAPQPANAADNDEIIAVIAAAVAAMGEAEGKSYRVRSVRASGSKSSRSAWSMAGLQNDTMPF